jgi:hypothetical protein
MSDLPAEKVSYEGDDIPSPTKEHEVEITDIARKKILRKLDVHLLPFVSLLYLLSFLWVNAPRIVSF